MVISLFFLYDFTDSDYPQISMTSDYYEKKTVKGILTLRRVGCFWELRLFSESNPEGIVLRSDYADPDQAAFDASRSDFGIKELDQFLSGVYVPSDLKRWRTSPSTYYKKIVNPVKLIARE
jgi:hypothetical protein